MNTPTPRTDAATALTSQHRHDDSFGDPEFGWVTAGFARELERELATERARLDYIRTELALLREWQREVIQNANAHHAERKDAIARAERAEAELAKERARLDWLEKSGPWESWNGFGETGITLRKNARAAIDAAMKEGGK